MSYRSDLDALAARHDALTAEVAEKTRELAETTELLEQARSRVRLPVLENIRVAAPCKVPWDSMTGDDRTRFCGQCEKHVYNLSGMTRDEAEALLVARNGELCVRYYQRPDGTILLADCAVAGRARRRRRWIVAGAAALLAGGAGAALLAGSAGSDDRRGYAVGQGLPVVHQGGISADEHYEMGRYVTEPELRAPAPRSR